jgi:hypothetical protein
MTKKKPVKKTTKNRKSSEDPYFNLGKLFEKFQELGIKNESDHNSIRMELQHMSQTQGERLMKIESEPSPQDFQKLFCPNTKAMDLSVKWIEKHERWHEERQKEDRQQAKEQRRLMWSAIVTAVVSLTIFCLNILSTRLSGG